MKFSLEDQLKIIQTGKYSLIDFSIITDRRYKPAKLHETIADKLEAVERGEIKRLMIFVPPRHGKSQLASINFPAWYLGRNPNKEVITASYSAELAQDFGGKTRELFKDDRFQKIFKTRLKQDEQNKAKWKTTEAGSYTSVGIGGAITGRGADLLIIDDPIKNREEAESKLIRDKHWNWYTSTAYTRLEKDAAVVLILTRWNIDDLAGRLLAKQAEGGDKWDVIELPAIKDDMPLWPEKYDLDALEQIKETIGLYDWSALYQQKPIMSELQEFKPEWIREVERSDVDRMNTRNFLIVDTAMSKKESADYCGFSENYVDKENNWNLAGYRMKLNPKELVDYLFTLQDKRNFEKIGIEKTAYTWGLKPYLDEEMRKRNRFLPIVEVEHKNTNKEVRIRGLIPRYSSGSIYHIKGECKALEEEMLTFPQCVNDDVIDATQYQNDIAEQPELETNNYNQPDWEDSFTGTGG
jgi:hypothetical protein